MKRRSILIGAGSMVTTLGAGAASTIEHRPGHGSDSSSPASRPIGNVLDPTYIEARLDSRSISAENPDGARGNGGKTGHGRKGNPSRTLAPGEKFVVADIAGPGTLRHIWITTDYGAPEVLRAQRLEIFYDQLEDPSISVPLLDFFGLPHGRHAEYYSALISVNEGLGLNSYIPIPFTRSIRVEITNESSVPTFLYYQIDYTLESSFPLKHSFLHATFRRENPTTPRQDFVVCEGMKGPGRFIGCSVGIRVLDKAFWYGEGEMKIYRDGDQQFPTYCGTGLEDYVGSAFNLNRHFGLYSGSPINIPANANAHRDLEKRMPDFASFYRWHLPDPIMFSHSLRVTLQQLGPAWFKKGQEAEFEAFKSTNPMTVNGWRDPAGLGQDFIGFAMIERSDDYCATAYVYCEHPQPVPRFSTALATRDIGLLPFETKFDPMMSG
jgi:hypothetical protein